MPKSNICTNCKGDGLLCRRCGRCDGECRERNLPCNGNAEHDFVPCPECKGEGIR